MKMVKAVLFSFLGVFLLIGLAIPAFITFADPNDFKPFISEQIKKSTGRELLLNGNLEWSFWPKIAIKTGPVVLENHLSFEQREFFAVENIEVSVATLPLLKKRVQADKLIVQDLRLNLAVDKEGVSNWSDLTSNTEQKKAENPSFPFATLMIGGIDIQDGQITYVDMSESQSVNVEKINISTGDLDFNNPIDLNLSLNLISENPDLLVELLLDAVVNYDLENETLDISPLNITSTLHGDTFLDKGSTIELVSDVSLNLDEGAGSIEKLSILGLGTELRGDVFATKLTDPLPNVEGQVTFSGKKLLSFISYFNLPVGQILGPKRDGPFSLETAFSADMQNGEITITKLATEILGANLTGTFSAEKINTKTPNLIGNLSAAGPDMPSILAVIAQLRGADASLLNELDKNLKTVKNKSFSISAEMQANLANGTASVPMMELKMLDSKFLAEVQTSNISSPNIVVDTQISAGGEDFSPFFAMGGALAPRDNTGQLLDYAKNLSKEKHKSFGFELDLHTNLEEGVLSVKKLDAQLLGVHLKAMMQGNNLNWKTKAGSLDGSVVVEAKDLRTFLRTINQSELAQQLLRLEINGGVQGQLDNLSLSPVGATVFVKNNRKSTPVEVTANIENASINLQTDVLTVEQVMLSGLGVESTLSARVENLSGSPEIKGQFSTNSMNLKRIARTLGRPPLETSNVKALTEVSLSTEFSATPNSLRIENIESKIDSTKLRGHFELLDFEKPRISTALDIDHMNLDEYLATTPKTTKKSSKKKKRKKKAKKSKVGPKQANKETAVLFSENALNSARELDMKVDLSISNLLVSGARIQNIQSNLEAKEGLIRLAPITANLYGGKYSGKATFDARKRKPEFTVSNSLSDVNLGDVFAETMKLDVISGSVELDSTINTEGTSVPVMLKKLNGNAAFSVNNGSVKGVNADRLLRKIEQMIECKCPQDLPNGGRTKFSDLKGTLEIKNGVMLNKDLLIDGNGFRLNGKGTLANFHNDRINYDLNLTVAQSQARSGSSKYNLGGYALPIQCKGTIYKPSCKPDATQILQQIAKRTATEKVKKVVGEKLKKALGGDAKEALKSIFNF